MDIYRELYYGWLILAVSEESCWTFECHKPGGNVYFDQKAYQTLEQAMNAAKEFVQRVSAEVALRRALYN